MFAISRRMTRSDFMLMGASIALFVVLWWPPRPDQQTLEVRTAEGQIQRYSVPVDDPSLEAIQRRLKQWRRPLSTRKLRTARWHQQLADFYREQDASTTGNHSARETAQSAPKPQPPTNSVAQVSFEKGPHDQPPSLRGTIAEGTQSAPRSSFWAALSAASATRIANERRKLEVARNDQVPPITLGQIVPAARSPLAYPMALLIALSTVGLAVIRQRARPPIELACSLESVPGTIGPGNLRLQIPANWVRVQQPIEVLLWRTIYAMSVGAALAAILFASFR